MLSSRDVCRRALFQADSQRARAVVADGARGEIKLLDGGPHLFSQRIANRGCALVSQAAPIEAQFAHRGQRDGCKCGREWCTKQRIGMQVKLNDLVGPLRRAQSSDEGGTDIGVHHSARQVDQFDGIFQLVQQFTVVFHPQRGAQPARRALRLRWRDERRLGIVGRDTRRPGQQRRRVGRLGRRLVGRTCALLSHPA